MPAVTNVFTSNTAYALALSLLMAVFGMGYMGQALEVRVRRCLKLQSNFPTAAALEDALAVTVNSSDSRLAPQLGAEVLPSTVAPSSASTAVVLSSPLKPSTSSQPQSKGQGGRTYARPLHEKYGRDWAVAHKWSYQAKKNLEDEQRVASDIQNTITVVMWTKSNKAAHRVNVITTHPRSLIPKDHDELASLIDGEVISVYQRCPIPEWIIQRTVVPIPVSSSCRILLRTPCLQNNELLGLVEELALQCSPSKSPTFKLPRPIAFSHRVLSDALPPASRVALSMLETASRSFAEPLHGIAEVGAQHSDASAVLLASPTKRAASEGPMASAFEAPAAKRRCVSSIPMGDRQSEVHAQASPRKSHTRFPLDYVVDMAPRMEVLSGIKQAIKQQEMFGILFPNIPFISKTFLKHRLAFQRAQQLGLIPARVAVGQTDEGKWNLLVHDVEALYKEASSEELSPDLPVEPPKPMTPRLSTESSTISAFTEVPAHSKGPTCLLPDAPEIVHGSSSMAWFNLDDHQNLACVWSDEGASPRFVIGDLMVVGGRKVVQQIRATVHDCDLIYAIKDYLIDGWWNPLDHEMGLWYEAARLARAQLFWLDFQHLATRYGVETYSRDT
ncbi:hypothetical protein HYDPIDRAFT_170284 [Hydnomerulius pinastri MD-312]|uniref:Uncharacterized protein n=1 Tax=Hydnomerulius pinastri MD-312 TaxID=994086 RepID=A0A0C9VRD7_9AGAM|nr:hypothetical protein HYDPIDRAFT_170284 [Hydnomerulius pinastri MD-312]